MWKPKPMPFLKTEKSPQPERRVINLVHTVILLPIKVVGEAGASPLVTVQTVNISPQGLSTVIPIIGGQDIGIGDQYTVSQGRSIRAMGKVKWV
jgi:hypothetical protein